MAPVHKVALVQLHAQAGKPADNMARAASFVREAARQGCHLAVLPEYHVTSWRPEDPAFFRQAGVEAAGYLARYQDLAREVGICIVPGTMLERATEEDEDGAGLGLGLGFTNVAYFISATGEVCGRYEKKNLWHPERAHLVTPSAHAPHRAFDTPLGRVGLLICWDLAFPEAFRELVADGAAIVCLPAFWSLRDVNAAAYKLNRDGEAVFINSTVVSRAFENTCAVVFVNVGGPVSAGESTAYAGQSQLAMPHLGPLGRLGRAEGMSVVDLDMAVLDTAEDNYRVRQDMKGAGWHYAFTTRRDGGAGKL